MGFEYKAAIYCDECGNGYSVTRNRKIDLPSMENFKASIERKHGWKIGKKEILCKLCIEARAYEEARKLKYAIYKNNVGLYDMQYVDTLAGCRDLMGGHMVKEEDLPIVVNRAGGRHSFNPDDKDFVEIVEIDKDAEPLTREQRYPKNSLDFEYGWISPQGDTYNTGYEGHMRGAEYICKELGYNSYNGERELEERGWVKISAVRRKNGWKPVVYATDCYITKAQSDQLFELGLYEDRNVRMFVEVSQNRW